MSECAQLSIHARWPVQFGKLAELSCESLNGLALTGEAVVTRYSADAEAAIAILAEAGTQVVFAGAPISPR